MLDAFWVFLRFGCFSFRERENYSGVAVIAGYLMLILFVEGRCLPILDASMGLATVSFSVCRNGVIV
jgi:hypothetical protein